MRKLPLVLILGGLFAVTVAGRSALIAETPKDEIALTAVSYDGMMKEIAKLKGKVVLVDVWADYCIPCKEKFPKMLEMHKKYSADGLQLVTLTIDDPEDKAIALAYLKKSEAKLPNYLLDDTKENHDKWFEKFPTNAVPILHLFDREGNKVKTFSRVIDPKEVEDAVKELLKK